MPRHAPQLRVSGARRPSMKFVKRLHDFRGIRDFVEEWGDLWDQSPYIFTIQPKFFLHGGRVWLQGGVGPNRTGLDPSINYPDGHWHASEALRPTKIATITKLARPAATATVKLMTSSGGGYSWIKMVTEVHPDGSWEYVGFERLPGYEDHPLPSDDFALRASSQRFFGWLIVEGDYPAQEAVSGEWGRIPKDFTVLDRFGAPPNTVNRPLVHGRDALVAHYEGEILSNNQFESFFTDAWLYNQTVGEPNWYPDPGAYQAGPKVATSVLDGSPWPILPGAGGDPRRHSAPPRDHKPLFVAIEDTSALLPRVNIGDDWSAAPAYVLNGQAGVGGTRTAHLARDEGQARSTTAVIPASFGGSGGDMETGCLVNTNFRFDPAALAVGTRFGVFIAATEDSTHNGYLYFFSQKLNSTQQRYGVHAYESGGIDTTIFTSTINYEAPVDGLVRADIRFFLFTRRNGNLWSIDYSPNFNSGFYGDFSMFIGTNASGMPVLGGRGAYGILIVDQATGAEDAIECHEFDVSDGQRTYPAGRTADQASPDRRPAHPLALESIVHARVDASFVNSGARSQGALRVGEARSSGSRRPQVFQLPSKP